VSTDIVQSREQWGIRGYGVAELLINADVGWVPGNVFATIDEGLSEFAARATTHRWVARG
jgi:hypothetical protein